MATASEPGDRPEVVEVLRQYLAEQPVEFGLLFGSYATETATDRSDIDIVLKFPNTMADEERFSRRNRITGELMARLGRDDVDVSDLDQLPTAIAHAALQQGIRIDGDAAVVDAHRQETASTYERTADDRQRSREAHLSRLEQGTYGR